MIKSESIAALATALSKLQGEIKDVAPNKKNHRSEYVDLSAMLKEVRPLLAKYGLSLTQLVGNADDKVTVESVLLHESGEWISSSISVPVSKSGASMNDLQSIGSSISYARRYALGALFNYTKDDDDDDGVSYDNHKPQPNAYQPKQKEAQQEYKKPEPQAPKAEAKDTDIVSKEMVFKLSKLCFDAKVDMKKLQVSYKVKALEELTVKQAKEIAGTCKDIIAEKENNELSKAAGKVFSKEDYLTV